jgi:SAM-dependent methyltransferase
MTATQQYVISLEQPPLLNVKPVTADMTRIPLPDHSQDAVLCNNSLQWCLQWPKAIEEMARILDPSRKPWAYLVVHTHERPMHIGTDTGECPIKMPRVLVPGILDELERHGFSIMTTRQIHGGAKTGQGQAGFERLFIKAEFTPGGLRHSWRNATTSLDTVRAMRLKK